MTTSLQLPTSQFKEHTAAVLLDVVVLGSLQSPMVMFGSKLTVSTAITKGVSINKDRGCQVEANLVL